jgi:hypothetical protein
MFVITFEPNGQAAAMQAAYSGNFQSVAARLAAMGVPAHHLSRMLGGFGGGGAPPAPRVPAPPPRRGKGKAPARGRRR